MIWCVMIPFKRRIARRDARFFFYTNIRSLLDVHNGSLSIIEQSPLFLAHDSFGHRFSPSGRFYAAHLSISIVRVRDYIRPRNRLQYPAQLFSFSLTSIGIPHINAPGCLPFQKFRTNGIGNSHHCPLAFVCHPRARDD